MKRIIILSLLSLAFLGFTRCSDDDNTTLKNDLIKKSVAPLVVGEKIEFSYAAGTTDSKLQSFKVVASAPGAGGTNFEPYTWQTKNKVEISTVVASNCETNGAVSTAEIIDSQATTLRYYYVVPAELKGKQVSFVFSATSKDGKTATYETPSYAVSSMDMKKLIELSGEDTGARYFSIEDMKAYTLDEINSGNLMSKIDFIYAFATTKTVSGNQYTYKHAFFAPGATMYYPDGFSLPSGLASKETLMDKKLYVWDGQLKDDSHNTIYVDDLDLQKVTFDNSTSGILDLKAEGGIFMKTADGKQVAYIYINSVNDASKKIVIGIKKLSSTK
ncbi:DUF4466 family protein [Dysgonomonas reticulitermitis]